MLKKKFSGIVLIVIISFIPLYSSFPRIIPSMSTKAMPGFQTFIFNPNAVEELVIYTHDSFMAWGLPTDYEFIMNQTFYNFGIAHNVTITVNVFSGMVGALNLLISQKANPQADLVIGLDNTLVSRAKQENILQQITTGVNLENVSSDIITALDPEKFLIPIDYGLIAVIFDTEFITTTSHPEIHELNFTNLLSTFGADLAVQDPTQSSTGLNFLLYQIVFYEEILGLDWKEWWEEAKDVVTIDKSWSDSWNRVFSTKEDHMMVSYGTDPAYNAFFEYSYEQNAALIHKGSEKFGWLQIEGIGIVKGTTKEALAKEYINYALSSEVQDYIATNNWMFPANNKTILPSCYDYAITTENVTILNDLITADYIGESYQNWLNTWERLVYGSGLWWVWTLLAALVLISIGAITYFVVRSRTKIDVE